MFATCQNFKLPKYVSPIPDHRAWKVDALSIPWQNLNGYAFCPVAILPQLVQKMWSYPCQMIVLAPGWPGMPWFWDLIDLSTKPPLQLPLWDQLLCQPHNGRLHRNLSYLNLHAWHLDSTRDGQVGLSQKWKFELRRLKETHLEPSMAQGGPFMGSGVNRIRWMSPVLLFPKSQIS